MTNLKSMKTNIRKILFYSTMLSGFVCSAWYLFQANGKYFRNLLFAVDSNSFMDFFYAAFYASSGDAYFKAIHVNYPPFSEFIFRLFSLFFPESLIDAGSTAMRDSQIGLIVIMLFTIIPVCVLTFLFMQKKNGYGFEKLLFLLCFFLSKPMIVNYERGNMVVYALMFLLGFVLLYQSPDRVTREISYFCLAAAAGVKLYTAIFGVLLIREKRYKDALRCLIYGLVVFFGFFYFFGGVAGFIQFLSNMQASSADIMAALYGYKVGLNTILLELGELLSFDTRFSMVFVWAFCLLLFAAALKTRRKWECLLLLASLMIHVPEFSWHYTLMFLVIPLLFYLDDDESLPKWRQVIYSLCFGLIFILPPLFSRHSFSIFTGRGFPLDWLVIIESYALLFLDILVTVDIFHRTEK